MRLTNNFTLEELTFSQTAARRGISNVPTGETLDNLRFLAAMLEEVRALIGSSVVVSSGYRSPEVNAAVGGSANSAHMAGLAADITAPRFGSARSLARAIASSDIQHDEVINEFGSWVHFGVRLTNPRRQVLTAELKDGRVTYRNGLA